MRETGSANTKETKETKDFIRELARSQSAGRDSKMFSGQGVKRDAGSGGDWIGGLVEGTRQRLNASTVAQAMVDRKG
jgi:hypothetical protein